MKLYVVVRGDLKPGAMVAQSCHALRAFTEVHPEVERRWYRESSNLVVLEVPNEDALFALVGRLAKEGVEIACFREPDMNGEMTAISAGPAAQRHLSSLPLALKEVAAPA